MTPTATRERRRGYLWSIQGTYLIPPEVTVPKPVAAAADSAREAYAEVRRTGSELKEARRLARSTERDDMRALEAAIKAGEEPPDPVEPERRDALAAAERANKAATRVAQDALYDQAAVVAKHAEEWRAKQGEAIAESVHEIEDLLGSLLIAFRRLRAERGVASALEHAADPAGWSYGDSITAERDEARYELALKRAGMPVARRNATVTKSVHDLLAALAVLASE